MATAFDAVWTGAVDSQWLTAGNWSPANEPTVNERILIPAGTRSIECVGMSNIQYTSLYVAPGYTGNIGTSGTRLTCSFVDLVHKGSGKIYFAEGSGTTTTFLVDAPGNVDAIDCTGSMTNFYLLRGTATLSGAGSYTLITVGHRGSPSGDATLTITSSGGTQAEIMQYGGRVTNASTCTLLYCMAGTFIQQTGTAITTANVGGAGNALLQYESVTQMTLCRVLAGGTLDVTKNHSGVAVLTVATLNLLPGSLLIEDPLLLTVTNRNDWR